VYVLDSGLALGNTTVAAEFGWTNGQTWEAVQNGTAGRAFNYYDFTYFGGSLCGLATAGSTGYCGQDMLGHGTQVASIIGGTIAGVAKGAKILMVKVGNGYDASNWLSNAIAALNSLATAGTPRGTIVNMSLVMGDPNCNTLSPGIRIQPAWESAVTAAYNAGLIIVTAAGNDGCDTANYSPTRIPQAFVVGATSDAKFSIGKDERAYWGTINGGPSLSRTGTNISVFAPANNVTYLNYVATSSTNSFKTDGVGISLATAYVSGTFAVACQAAGTYCNTVATSDIYSLMRSNAVTGTVINRSETQFNNVPYYNSGTPSRFIQQKW
jgi:hypothetical protein